MAFKYLHFGGKMRQEKEDTKPSFEAELNAYAARRASRPVDWNAQLRRWPVYAAATGAALAMTTSAEASSIVSGFSGQRISILGYNFLGDSIKETQVNFNGLGNIDLELFTSHSQNGVIYSHSGRARVFANGGTQVDAKSGLLARFSSGKAITNGMALSAQGSLHFHLFKTFASQHIPLTSTNIGLWPSQKTGFAGFKLANGDLGWIQLVWSGSGFGFPTGLEALYWEVNTTPGAPITTEQPPPAAPEPGTLGLALLAAGAAGVTALRKRRQATA